MTSLPVNILAFPSRRLVDVGTMTFTPEAYGVVRDHGAEFVRALTRYRSEDWGDIEELDVMANDMIMRAGQRDILYGRYYVGDAVVTITTFTREGENKPTTIVALSGE